MVVECAQNNAYCLFTYSCFHYKMEFSSLEFSSTNIRSFVFYLLLLTNIMSLENDLQLRSNELFHSLKG